jgi:hypothetical protein
MLILALMTREGSHAAFEYTIQRFVPIFHWVSLVFGDGNRVDIKIKLTGL